MSSDNSDDNGTRYVVNELSWKSRKQKGRNSRINFISGSKASKPRSVMIQECVRGEELSLQSKPEDCPEWACIDSNNIISNSEFTPLNNYFLYKGHNLANHYANLDGMTLT